MARAFKRKRDHLVARLGDAERALVVMLLQQTHDLLAPVPRERTGDPFDDLVAELGLPRMKDLKNPDDLFGMDDPANEDEPVPRDPALERLLPSAHRDDPHLAAEFRRLTEYGLRERKAANLATAIMALQSPDGDKVRLDLDQAHATVVALTDVRLFLGERLGLRTDDDANALVDRLEEQSEDDPRLYLAACYDFLTWLQESLTQALMA